MDLRNKIGLYGSYFLGMAAIGFTLPYLPLYLSEKGLSDRAIGIVSTLAALSGLAQFPVGLYSDRIGHRKPFLVAALAAITVATFLLRGAADAVWVAALVIVFAENGVGRAIVESLSGAEAASLAPRDQIGSAIGALRFWKPIGIVIVALVGGWLVENHGISAAIFPLAIIQAGSVGLALLIHRGRPADKTFENEANATTNPEALETPKPLPRDPKLWAFVAAMVLFHAANAPGGIYLGLFLKRELHAPDRMLAHAFVVSMIAWMIVVWPAGYLADRLGRKPLLIAGWAVMATRLALISFIHNPTLAVANQALDGLGNGIFAVLAAAWVTDRLADPRRSGEAQVIVGSALVLGSAIGPAISGILLETLGYRGLFLMLAGFGAVATAIVIFLVPETLSRSGTSSPTTTEPMAATTDLSTVP